MALPPLANQAACQLQALSGKGRKGMRESTPPTHSCIAIKQKREIVGRGKSNLPSPSLAPCLGCRAQGAVIRQRQPGLTAPPRDVSFCATCSHPLATSPFPSALPALPGPTALSFPASIPRQFQQTYVSSLSTFCPQAQFSPSLLLPHLPNKKKYSKGLHC